MSPKSLSKLTIFSLFLHYTKWFVRTVKICDAEDFGFFSNHGILCFCPQKKTTRKREVGAKAGGRESRKASKGSGCETEQQ